MLLPTNVALRAARRARALCKAVDAASAAAVGGVEEAEEEVAAATVGGNGGRFRRKRMSVSACGPLLLPGAVAAPEEETHASEVE